MPNAAEELQAITDFSALLPFLKNRMGWPIDQDILDEDDPLEESTFEFTPKELGIDPDKARNIRGIRLLRPFYSEQPFGVFLISFEDKNLKITAMRRILRALVKKRPAVGDDGTQQVWDTNDLMFISNFGESGHRKLSFAHFHQNDNTNELPTLRVIGWDADDTHARMRIQAGDLVEKLNFPVDPADTDAWRAQWSAAFTRTPGHVINTTKELVKQLAMLATQTRGAIEEVMALESQSGVLHGIMNSFKTAIFPDLKPTDFADMYAQTVAYGLLQARISRTSGGLVLDDAANLMGSTNPFLKELFKSFLSVGDNKANLNFDEIGLSEVRDLLADAEIEQVLADFGNRNPNQDPTIHLYENFLKEYDKDRQNSRGVFYTPQQVVGFIVRSVHETLQSDFGLTDGLADTTTWAEFATSHKDVRIPDGWAEKPFVQILDPATGTGTFLIETIDLIHTYLIKKWQDAGKSDAEITALWQDYVPAYLLPRLHGFELMMAPYAMAHLGIALKLESTGYNHADGAPRAQIYLTNTLAEPFDAQTQLAFMADVLAEEGRGANHIKTGVPITVVIGNPPYAGHSKNPSKAGNGKRTWIGELIQPYFFVDGAPLGERNPKWLNDDYVKFIRYAEYRLEQSGVGVLGYITNHSFLENPTFRGMRQYLIDGSSSLFLLDLHGNTQKKEISPNGAMDENVFDIQQGVSITILSKIGHGNGGIKKANLYGPRHGNGSKLNTLATSSVANIAAETITPKTPFYLLIECEDELESEFRSFFSVADIIPTNGVGIVTARDHFCIQETAEDVGKILKDVTSLDTEAARIKYSLGADVRDWKVHLAQQDIEQSNNKNSQIVPINYRPFDERHTFYTGKSRGFICRPRPEVMRHMFNRDNLALVTVRQMPVTGSMWHHAFLSNSVMESCLISNRTKEINYLFPLKLLLNDSGNAEAHPNLSPEFLAAVTASTDLAFQPLVAKQPEQQPLGTAPEQQQNLIATELQERGDMITTFGCRDIFDYIYAVLHSPTYRTRYAEFLKSDFPRIPLPKGRDIFAALVPLGAELVALHLLDDTHPKLAKPNIVFRGKGDNRLFKKNQIKWDNGKMPINAAQWFEDVPQESVEFSIGGYKPLQKWLHDRAEKGTKKAPLPGRVLTSEDIMHYRSMVVAITETRRVMQDIDATIETHGGWPGAFTIGDDNG